MYGRQPPSSQIRAAHIDWDSLSMMEEAAAAWGHGGGGNRGDLPVWQQGMGLPIDFACGGMTSSKSGAAQSQLNFQRAHLPAGAMGEGVPLHLQHIYQQQQQLHYHHLQQQQHQQLLQQQLMLQQHQRQQQQAARSPDALHAHMSMTAAAAAAASNRSGSGLPGSLGDVCAVMARVAVANEWERQMAWDYACHHHPLLASFSVASPLKLSAVWRWVLLIMLVIGTL
ncbi:hypothetical protein GGI21_005596, partial [Coemansia aciculifera]